MTETNTPPPPSKGKDPFAFIIATVCALPFVYLVIEMFTDHRGFSQALVSSVFFSPLMLLATVAEPIFIVLAWMKSPYWCRPVLIFYLLAMLTYWSVIVLSGSW